MGEEGGGDSEFDRVVDAEDGAVVGGDDHDEDDDGRVLDWMIGLPSGEDLTPLSQLLVPPGLASAFSVSPEPRHTALDVERASRYTISSIRRVAPSAAASDALRSFSPFLSEKETPFESGDPAENAESSCDISALGPPVSSSSALLEAGPSTPQPDESCDDPCARNRKRPRLAWTPQLHKRFIDVVTHLGITNAMPKTIMQMMNVEGLTRENIASHLQKYRLYLKRVQRISDEAPAPPSPSDHSYASVLPNTKSLHRHHARSSIQYPMSRVIPMPVFGMAHPGGHGGLVANHQANGSYHLFDQQHSSQSVSKRMNHWYGGSNFGSLVSHFQVTSD